MSILDVFAEPPDDSEANESEDEGIAELLAHGEQLLESLGRAARRVPQPQRPNTQNCNSPARIAKATVLPATANAEVGSVAAAARVPRCSATPPMTAAAHERGESWAAAARNRARPTSKQRISSAHSEEAVSVEAGWQPGRFFNNCGMLTSDHSSAAAASDAVPRAFDKEVERVIDVFVEPIIEEELLLLGKMSPQERELQMPSLIARVEKRAVADMHASMRGSFCKSHSSPPSPRPTPSMAPDTSPEASTSTNLAAAVPPPSTVTPPRAATAVTASAGVAAASTAAASTAAAAAATVRRVPAVAEWQDWMHNTSFFRDGASTWDFAADRILYGAVKAAMLQAHASNASRPRPVRVWSCGCSSGEELFTTRLACEREPRLERTISRARGSSHGPRECRAR